MGKPGFPAPLPVRGQALCTGRVWEGAALPGNNPPAGRVGASPLRREGSGGLRPPWKQPASGEGLGGLRPPKNNYFHSGVVRRSRIDD